jgi:hypothetical protein
VWWRLNQQGVGEEALATYSIKHRSRVHQPDACGAVTSVSGNCSEGRGVRINQSLAIVYRLCQRPRSGPK